MISVKEGARGAQGQGGSIEARQRLAIPHLTLIWYWIAGVPLEKSRTF